MCYRDTRCATVCLAEHVCCFYKHLLCVPFVMYCEGFVVFTCNLHCLQTSEHVTAGRSTKIRLSAKFEVCKYLLGCLKYWEEYLLNQLRVFIVVYKHVIEMHMKLIYILGQSWMVPSISNIPLCAKVL